MESRNCWCGGSTYVDLDAGIAGRIKCQESIYHAPFATGESSEVTRLYIAGPMTGYPECNYPAFHAAQQRLQEANFRVVNPAERVDSKLARHYVDLLRDDLRLLLDCHGVAVLPGWEWSTGARNEVQVAGTLRMYVKTVDDWVATGPQRTQGR